jgi:AmmeMemoRadiSam system protein A
LLVGVFVTLRKDGALRGCVGNFDTASPLADALARAAASAAVRDPRFPPVTADELPRLTVELSLLHSRQVLGTTAQERADQLTIGKHGLHIQWGQRTGLLLPRVALDLQCDAVSFLEQVCLKAGLPADRWRDPRAALHCFQAICFGGPCKFPNRP